MLLTDHNAGSIWGPVCFLPGLCCDIAHYRPPRLLQRDPADLQTKQGSDLILYLTLRSERWHPLITTSGLINSKGTGTCAGYCGLKAIIYEILKCEALHFTAYWLTHEVPEKRANRSPSLSISIPKVNHTVNFNHSNSNAYCDYAFQYFHALNYK